MKILSFAAQKGGVGKTTLAVNLAVAAQAKGIRTVVADLDPQESATAWGERRPPGDPEVGPVSARRLPGFIEASRACGIDLLIIDTPPSAGGEALIAAQAADLILVPCRPSLIDLEAIRRTAQLVAMSGKPGYVVLNAAPVAARALLAEAQQLVNKAGIDVAPAIIRERAAWRHAWPAGQAVTEYDPAGKAAAELDGLLLFVSAMLHITSPERI